MGETAQKQENVKFVTMRKCMLLTTNVSNVRTQKIMRAKLTKLKMVANVLKQRNIGKLETAQNLAHVKFVTMTKCMLLTTNVSNVRTQKIMRAKLTKLKMVANVLKQRNIGRLETAQNLANVKF